MTIKFGIEGKEAGEGSRGQIMMGLVCLGGNRETLKCFNIKVIPSHLHSG